MRTSERIGLAAVLTVAFFATGSAVAFEGTSPGGQEAALPMVPAPGGIGVMKKPVPPADIPQAAASTSLTALQYAAEGGHPIAQWKLGRMYAKGDGVAQDDLRAYDYFSRVANAHAEDSPTAPQAAVVANAFVALGRYYLSGIPNSKVKADPERAREMFSYAARISGMPKRSTIWRGCISMASACRVIRGMAFAGSDWRLGRASIRRRHCSARCCSTAAAPSVRPRGLMWLTLAQDSARGRNLDQGQLQVMAKASDDDRAMALQMLERWVQGRRD
jgi:hypothetical protein